MAELWGDPQDYISAMEKAMIGLHRLERGLFHWKIERFGYCDIYQLDWHTVRRFWRRSMATACLVQLALEGKRVEL